MDRDCLLSLTSRNFRDFEFLSLGSNELEVIRRFKEIENFAARLCKLNKDCDDLKYEKERQKLIKQLRGALIDLNWHVKDNLLDYKNQLDSLKGEESELRIDINASARSGKCKPNKTVDFWTGGDRRLPKAIIEYYEFNDIYKSFGGWKRDDHIEFCRVYQRSIESNSCIEIAQLIDNMRERLRFHSAEELRDHIAWYRKYLDLQKAYNDSLRNWKEKSIRSNSDDFTKCGVEQGQKNPDEILEIMKANNSRREKIKKWKIEKGSSEFIKKKFREFLRKNEEKKVKESFDKRQKEMKEKMKEKKNRILHESKKEIESKSGSKSNTFDDNINLAKIKPNIKSLWQRDLIEAKKKYEVKKKYSNIRREDENIWPRINRLKQNNRRICGNGDESHDLEKKFTFCSLRNRFDIGKDNFKTISEKDADYFKWKLKIFGVEDFRAKC